MRRELIRLLSTSSRTKMTNYLVGAHVSTSNGVHEAIGRINKLKGNAFALFLKNQKRWVSKPYEEVVVAQFIKNCSQSSFDAKKSILPHGSYMINLANPDGEKLLKSKEALLDDLQRCEQLGIGLYNLHPGSTLGTDKDKAIKQIGESINEMHTKTKFVKIVLENMTGQDKIVGSNIGDLRDIINYVDDKSRVGVCIDTCHSFCAGYDLRTEKTFKEFWDLFEKTVGYEYLSGVHLNDSKFPYDSKRDVHENIGVGFIGLEAFRLIMNKKELEGIPLILETPLIEELKSDDVPDTRGEEIALLRWLIGKEKDDKELLEKSKKLQEKGKSVREKNQLAVDNKKGKDTKKVKVTKNKKISFTKASIDNVKGEITEEEDADTSETNPEIATEESSPKSVNHRKRSLNNAKEPPKRVTRSRR